MRSEFVVLTATVLVAFAAEGAGTDGAQQAQASDSPAGVIAPEAPATVSAPVAPEVAAAPDGAGGASEQASVEMASPPGDAAVAAEAASAAVQATPAAATTSDPIMLKMAKVPPPADFKIPAGYKATKRGLDTLYCTSITTVGSRMPKTYCLTREQVEERQRQAEIARRDLAQKTGSCDGGGCGAN